MKQPEDSTPRILPRTCESSIPPRGALYVPSSLGSTGKGIKNTQAVSQQAVGFPMSTLGPKSSGSDFQGKPLQLNMPLPTKFSALALF